MSGKCCPVAKEDELYLHLLWETTYTSKKNRSKTEQKVPIPKRATLFFFLVQKKMQNLKNHFETYRQGQHDLLVETVSLFEKGRLAGKEIYL